MSSSDEELFSQDESLTYDNRVKLYGNYSSDEEDIDISETEIEKQAADYIEYISGRFMYKDRRKIGIDELPRIIWDEVLWILRVNFNNPDYNITLCRLIDTYSRNKTKINRTIDCFSLFKAPSDPCNKFRYLHEIETSDISRLAIKNDIIDRRTEETEFTATIIFCRDIIVRRLFEYISFCPKFDINNP